MLAFSQYHNGFAYFSDIVRASTTDMFIIYGQPVWDIAMLFRPFLIGYLFLNQAQGLSFFWASRLVFLFLVSFEFAMLITDNNKKLALSYSFLIAFSPLVQWWFAINGLVEMLIFGQLAIILINCYMNMDDYKKRILIALGLMVCAGTFLLVFYPSWQIPFAYVFVLLAVWIFLKNYHSFEYGKKDLLIFICVFAIFSIIMAHVLSNSLETITLIYNSAYPGGEVFNGMGDIGYFVNYISSIYFPINTEVPIQNVVELSEFIDFFPMPIILSFIVLFYQKTKDRLLAGLLALYLLFMIFYVFTLPDTIITLTLRSHIKSCRLFNVMGFIGCLMLIRSIADLKEFENKRLFIAFSIILASVMIYLSTVVFTVYYTAGLILLSLVIFSFVYSAIFLSFSQKGKTIFLICCIVLSFTAGALVNPVEHGTDVIFKSDYINEVEELVNQSPESNWIVNEMYGGILLPAGAKTINSVHTYPDIDKWNKIDPNNEYVDIYNRYAHFQVILVNDSPTVFELASPDVIFLHLNVNDLEKLNVTYIATANSLEGLSNENVTLNQIYSNGNYKIYKAEYS